jgi:hypothetical protein
MKFLFTKIILIVSILLMVSLLGCDDGDKNDDDTIDKNDSDTVDKNEALCTETCILFRVAGCTIDKCYPECMEIMTSDCSSKYELWIDCMSVDQISCDGYDMEVYGCDQEMDSFVYCMDW